MDDDFRSGYSYGPGFGFGFGGDGDGFGSGDGFGFGYSYDGSGDGCGYGSGFGCGFDDGDGCGIDEGYGVLIDKIDVYGIRLLAPWPILRIGCETHTLDVWATDHDRISVRHGVACHDAFAREILAKARRACLRDHDVQRRKV